MRIPSYSNVHSFGVGTKGLLDGPVLVEEKVDGSQMAMARLGGEFVARSRGKELVKGAVEKLFGLAYETGEGLDLREGWFYYGEAITKPRHNTLTYGRIPKGGFVLFDIFATWDDGCRWLSPEEKAAEAALLGIECVPCYYSGFTNPEQLKSFIGRESFLGQAQIEGIVVKPLNYDLIGRDGKVVMGKHVSEAFKEVHRSAWKVDNPGKADILEGIIKGLTTEARWQKAVYRLRDAGQLVGDPKDIGPLIKEVQADIQKEEEGNVKEAFWKWAKPHISRGVVRGLPEWYKDKLLRGEGDVEN